eukprot:1138926-Pelagomonas_calceolata.AAC.4
MAPFLVITIILIDLHRAIGDGFYFSPLLMPPSLKSFSSPAGSVHQEQARRGECSSSGYVLVKAGQDPV